MGIVRHDNETEPFGATGLTVLDDVHRFNGSKRFEVLADIFLRRLIR
jgi:hypothetical protein